MVVCHCKAVTDRDVRVALDQGARHLLDLTRHCGAGRTCGGCRPTLRRLLDQARDERAEHAVDRVAVA